jgi:hypothetical protein
MTNKSVIPATLMEIAPLPIIFMSFRCPSFLAALTSCPEVVYICFFLCSLGLGFPFLAFSMRGSQAQIVVSFFEILLDFDEISIGCAQE